MAIQIIFIEGNLCIFLLQWWWSCSSVSIKQFFKKYLLLQGNYRKPCKMGGDRFIPVRNSKQMAVASFLLAKNQPFHANTTLSSVSHLWRSFTYAIIVITCFHFRCYRKNKRPGPLLWMDTTSIMQRFYTLEEDHRMLLKVKTLSAWHNCGIRNCLNSFFHAHL